jgi:thioesterase domain-containing protein/acyl carrier protein
MRANREIQTGSHEERLLNQLWAALGVDPKTTPNHITLGELGMESMFAVELQQALERDYDIKLSLADIKTINVKQVKEFQSGNKEDLKNLSKEIKIMRAKLTKIKFIIPTETYTKLNGVQNGNPIYFLPPVEGIFAALENLAKKINRPVIGLNWTEDMKNMTTIKEITAYYISLLKNLSPNGNYDIVGHSMGALIARKMLSKAPVGRAVIIDILSDSDLREDNINDEYFFESVNKFFYQILPKNLKERVMRDMNAIKGTNEKLKKISSELKEFGGKSLVDKDLDNILKNTFERGKLIANYRIKSMKKFNQFKQEIKTKFLKSNGKLFIITPFEDSNNNSIVSRIVESYYLPEKVFKEILQLKNLFYCQLFL